MGRIFRIFVVTQSSDNEIMSIFLGGGAGVLSTKQIDFSQIESVHFKVVVPAEVSF